MRKILLLIITFILCVQVSSCQKKTDVVDVDNVTIEVEHNIVIDLDDYGSSYDWSRHVHIFINDIEQDFNDVRISIKDTTTILPNTSREFEVSFTHKFKLYKKEFEVYFTATTINISIYGYGQTPLLQTIPKGGTVDISSIDTTIENMCFEGWFLDANYSTPYTTTMTFEKETAIYGKWTYQTTQNNIPSIDTIVTSKMNYIDLLISQTPSYIPAWNQEGFKGRWNYIDGVFLNSIVSLYKNTNNEKYKNFFLRYIDYYIDNDGNFINPQTYEKTGYRSGELDSVCASRILFDAYEMTHMTKYLNAIEKTYNELISMPKTTNGINYVHKTSYPNQIWLDGMYMYAPFYARYAKLKNQNDYYTMLTAQYRYIRENQFNEKKQLYFHGHDTSKSIFWADDKTGNSASFWLRSTGWFIVSLVDVLEYFPEGSDKNYLTNLLVEAVEGIMQYQDENSKMFFQLIDLGPTAFYVPTEYLSKLGNQDYFDGTFNKGAMINNYLESSGSSMVAYALLKGARLEYLGAKYSALGAEIYEGIYAHSFQNNRLTDICITAGLGPENKPYRDGSIAYYLAEPVGTNDAKGVGPFIMAFIEFTLEKNIKL